MEYIWIVCLAPLIITVGLLIACRVKYPGRIYRSTEELFRSFSRNKSGRDLVEYALMAWLVAVTIVAIVPGPATTLATIFMKVKLALDGSGPANGVIVSFDPILVNKIRIVCTVLAGAIFGIIIWRREKKQQIEEDD